MTMSHPPRKPISCSRYGVPPYTQTDLNPNEFPIQSKSANTCFASSRVGASTTHIGRRPCTRRPFAGMGEIFAISSTIGKTNANVFPHPVRARPTTSFPLSAISSVSA